MVVRLRNLLGGGYGYLLPQKTPSCGAGCRFDFLGGDESGCMRTVQF